MNSNLAYHLTAIWILQLIYTNTTSLYTSFKIWQWVQKRKEKNSKNPTVFCVCENIYNVGSLQLAFCHKQKHIYLSMRFFAFNKCLTVQAKNIYAKIAIANKNSLQIQNPLLLPIYIRCSQIIVCLWQFV